MTHRAAAKDLRSTIGLLCVPLILITTAATATAGTDGYSLGLDQLVPERPTSVSEPPPRPLDRPWQPPDEPVHLLPGPEHPLPGLPLRIGKDAVAMVAAPLDWEGRDWRKLGLGVLAVGAVSLLDEPIHNALDSSRTSTSERVAETLRPLSERGGLVLLGAAWLAGRGFHRPKLVAVAEDGLEAVILSAGIITPALKKAFGRDRPRDTDETRSFFGNGGSFPSGEATEAFAIASVVAAHSERKWVKITAWSLAGVLGFGRMELDGHWASDVVAGALIGSTVGRWVVRRNRPDLEGAAEVTIMPTIGSEHYGMAMHIRF